MKRLKTIANDLLELAENIEEWDKYMNKIKNPEEDEKLQAIINDRNELITKLILLDLETRFQFSERPAKAQAKWFKDNWGISESTLDFYRNRKSKSITKQYNDLENKNEILDDEEEIDTSNIDQNSVKEEYKTDSLKEEIQTLDVEDNTVKKDGKAKRNETMNKREIEDTIWDKVSFSNLCMVEPFHHTPFQYGDIMEDGKVFVWKDKYTDKETFLKSYVTSKNS